MKTERPCKYGATGGVICNEPRTNKTACDRCGWNPEVTARRKQGAREHGNRVQTLPAPEAGV
jgi:hypothetical protein